MARPAIDIQGLPELQGVLEDLSQGIGGKRLMAEIATFLMLRIKTRTAKGKDVDGLNFKPYTPSYAFFKQSKGHSTSKVNLFFTGSMMSSMTYTANENTARLFFLNTEDRFGSKNPTKAFFLNEKREFFAMSDSDITAITKMVNDQIGDLLG